MAQTQAQKQQKQQQGTTLQEALIAALGSEHYTFKAQGHEETVNIREIPDTSIAALFRYGDRHVNDRVNSDKHRKGGDSRDSFNRWLGQLKDGTLGSGSGGGGPRLDPVDKQAREIVAGWMRDKVKDATLQSARTKVTKNGWEAVARKLAVALGKDPETEVQAIRDNARKAVEAAQVQDDSQESISLDDLA